MCYIRNDRVFIQDILHVYLLLSFVCTEEQQQIESEHCIQEYRSSYQKYSNSCKETIDITIHPEEPSWFIIVPKGRLGNHLTGFAMIQALAFTLGIKPLITKSTNDYLKRYFDVKHNISIYENTFCKISNIPKSKMSHFEGSIDELLNNKIYHK